MADPTLRLTFSALRIRVAEYLGIAYYGAAGTEAAQLPTDAHDLDLVGRLVNDGYTRFITENDKWKFLAVPFSLTFGTGVVAADNARYYLPDDFYGILLHPFTYPSTGPRIAIQEVPESHIRMMQAGYGDSTGQPVMSALRPINVDGTSDGDRWEVIFWPEPSGTEVVTAIYRRFPASLSSASHTSVAGFQHDQTVLAAALAAAELQVDGRIGPYEQTYQTRLQASLRLDRLSGSSRVGDYGDKSEDSMQRHGRHLTYTGVDTYDGVSVE